MIRNFVISAASAIVLISAANAADIYRAPDGVSYKDAPIYAPVWSGFYLGIQGGGAWGDSIQTYNAGSTSRFDIKGAEFGGTLGYNWQHQHWVLGIETDLSGTNIKGSTGSTGTYSCGTICSTKVDAFGTVRGRIGYAWNNFLIFGTGGLAYGDIKSNLDGGIVNNWQTGWTAGAGAEYQFSPRWSAKLEWDYVKFDNFQWTNSNNTNYSCKGIDCSTDAKFSAVRVGLNYHFSQPYEPLK